MESVYGLRHRLAIGFRAFAYLKLRAFSKLVRMAKLKRFPDALSDIAIILHDTATGEDLGSAVNHLAWYLGDTGEDEASDIKLELIVPPGLDTRDLSLPPSQHDYLDEAPPYSIKEYGRARLGDHDFLLLWRIRSIFKPGILRYIDRVRPVDPGFFSGTENATWQIVMERSVDRVGRTELLETSRRNLEVLVDRWGGSEAVYVLGTGPSVEKILDENVGSFPVVICNSIVRNDRLLEHLNPAVVCFADEVFHFGPSEYAAKFRDDLLKAVERYNCFVVTRLEGAALLLRHYPDLRENIIGLPGVGGAWNVPSSGSFFVRPTGNIMTYLMLPVAGALGGCIRIGGADGRKPGETYFWRHGASVQYEGLMETAFETHPSFFRDRIYSDYYRQHIGQLADELEFLERSGHTIESVTFSHVPVLAERAVKH